MTPHQLFKVLKKKYTDAIEEVQKGTEDPTFLIQQELYFGLCRTAGAVSYGTRGIVEKALCKLIPDMDYFFICDTPGTYFCSPKSRILDKEKLIATLKARVYLLQYFLNEISSRTLILKFRKLPDVNFHSSLIAKLPEPGQYYSLVNPKPSRPSNSLSHE